VQGEGGVEPFSIGEVQNLAKFLRENGILLIVDEGSNGSLRTGERLLGQGNHFIHGLRPGYFINLLGKRGALGGRWSPLIWEAKSFGPKTIKEDYFLKKGLGRKALGKAPFLGRETYP